ncbi:P-loop containing nucleoside triphosphate hydrolase protein [Lyophyllum atratum]|nr:P-loop containing nucleoside triphosphate hydrolase protein [Lyophyllum atratum]
MAFSDPQFVSIHDSVSSEVPGCSPKEPINTSHTCTDETSKTLPAVIIFGEIGVGKSSIVNMLAGHDNAVVTNSSDRTTLEVNSHKIDLRGSPYVVLDTPGIDWDIEADRPDSSLIVNLIRGQRDRLKLLILCVKRGRVTDAMRRIYESCRKACPSVPMVLVITHLDGDDDLDSWWTAGAWKVFEKNGMRFVGHAGVAARSNPAKSSQNLADLVVKYSTINSPPPQPTEKKAPRQSGVVRKLKKWWKLRSRGQRWAMMIVGGFVLFFIPGVVVIVVLLV